MNAKNGTAFATKCAPRRARIASPRARSRRRREVTTTRRRPGTACFRVGTLGLSNRVFVFSSLAPPRSKRARRGRQRR